MDLITALTDHLFDLNREEDGSEWRYSFDNKEAADEFSEHLKDQWPIGYGQVYGPFVNRKINNGNKWYEVSKKNYR